MTWLGITGFGVAGFSAWLLADELRRTRAARRHQAELDAHVRAKRARTMQDAIARAEAERPPWWAESEALLERALGPAPEQEQADIAAATDDVRREATERDRWDH